MKETPVTPLMKFYANVQHHIDTHGWSIQVTPYRDDSLIAYTVGLSLKDLPELTLVTDCAPDSIKFAGTLLNAAAGLLTATPIIEFSPYLDVPVDTDPPAVVRFTLVRRPDASELKVAHAMSQIHQGPAVRALDLVTEHDTSPVES